jgi:hypothetical protein
MADGRARNVELSTKMFLSLGPDVMKIDGTRHDAELAEAKASAAHRWGQLLDPSSRSSVRSRPSPHDRPGLYNPRDRPEAVCKPQDRRGFSPQRL